MKKIISLIMVLALVLGLATTALAAESATPQDYYSGSIETTDWQAGLELPFIAPGDGVVTITVTNADPGFDVGEAYAGDWRENAVASGSENFTVAEGEEYLFVFYGHDGTSDCAATYDFVVTYTGEGTVEPYTPPVPGESMESPVELNSTTGSVKVPAGAMYYCLYSPMGPGGADMLLTVSGNTGFKVYSFTMGMPASATDAEGTATITAYYGRNYGGYMFAIENNTQSEQTYTFTMAEKSGTDSNPDDMVVGTNTATTYGDYDGYFYLWTAEEDGILTITMTEENWTYYVMVNGDQTTDNQLYSDDDEVVDVQVIEVVKNDQVIVWINSYDPENMADMNPAVEFSFDAAFAPYSTEDAPIELEEGDNAIGIPGKVGEDVGKAYATVDLDKETVLTIENYWSGITVDGTPYTANRLGVLTVLLAAGEHEIVLDNTLEDCVALTVNVAEPAPGSFENPIEVSAAGKLTNTSVEAGSEVYYAINGKLAGAVLTVKGNVVVMVDGSEVKAENGVVTVEIKPTGATMMLTIVNAGSSAATYEASVAYPDNPKTGDMGIILPALAMVMSACGAAFVCKKKD